MDVLTASYEGVSKLSRNAAGKWTKQHLGAGNRRPLAGYATLMGVYGAAVTAGAMALRRRNQKLPDVRAFDIALVGVATHKVARRMSKDSVTSLT